MTLEEYQREAHRLRPKLLQAARHYLDDDDAEDTVQDVLLRLWQMLDELRLPVDSLALVLTRNLCIDKVRRRQPLSALNMATDSDVWTSSETDERVERMMEVIATLPDLQQTVLRLRHIEGMEMKEIAELFGSNEQAIRKALSRARQAVRTQYKKQFNDYKE